jgi:hypothetical protein
MNQQQAVAKLRDQLQRLDFFLPGPDTAQSSPFLLWQRDTLACIRHIFGEQSRQASDFQEISFSAGSADSVYDPYCDWQGFRCGQAAASAYLESFITEIEQFGNDRLPAARDALQQVRLICTRFPLIADELGKRSHQRAPLTMDDEYDVQYLLHALLRLYFDDVRAEEWAPSYGGAASRMDFLEPLTQRLM